MFHAGCLRARVCHSLRKELSVTIVLWAVLSQLWICGIPNVILYDVSVLAGETVFSSIREVKLFLKLQTFFTKTIQYFFFDNPALTQ